VSHPRLCRGYSRPLAPSRPTHANIATAAGPIFDEEGLSPLLTELLSDNSADRIDRTTRLKRNHYPNRSDG